MSDPLYPQPQRNYLDDILDQAFDDLEMERQRQENIINAPDPAKRLGEIQRIEKQVAAETPEVQDAVRRNTYQDTSYYTGKPFKSQQPQAPLQPLVKPGLQPGEVGQWQGFVNAIKSGYKQGQMARNVIALEGGAEAEEKLKEIASLQAEIRGIPRSTAYNEFNKSKTFGGALKKLALDPIEITSQLVVESMASFLPTQIAGMMAGAGIGAGVGSIVPGIGTIAGAGSGALYGGITSAGLTSLGLEYSGKMLEVMGELGVNVEDPDDLARGFSDEKIMSEARELGLRKGVPIAIFDLVSAGVAGRFMKPGKSLASKAIQGSKEVGTQAVLGSTGEATGQISAGEEIQPSAIVAEGIAEIGQSAPSGATRLATQKFKSQKLEKAKAKGLEAIESGQLRQLTDQDISDFVRSVTKEEAMEIGIAQETGEIESQSELGKEMIRRNLEMEKFPETETEFREAGARANIKKQQMEGKDFVGKLIEKAQSESGIAIEREYLDRTVADEAEQEGWTEEETKQVLRDHGIDENKDPKKITITGTSFGGSVRISTAGTPKRMAEEYVAVQEEMAEEYYKAEQKNNSEFENEVAKDRRNYYEATGEQDTGESNLEWFSSKAVHFATQGKVHQSIGAKLTEIFNRFIDNARTILKDAFKLRKAIREGKVSDSLLKKLEEATDFKKVGEKVQQAKEGKKQPTYRLTTQESYELHDTAKRIFGTTEDFREAGYILLNGEMLDFSGKNEGGTPGTRSFDHRQINEVGFEDTGGNEKWEDIGMPEFIQSGAIRFMPESNKFHLGMKKPDTPQLGRMRQLIQGPSFRWYQSNKITAIITDEKENLKFEKKYDRNTPFEEIKRDILQFYRTGKGPSITQQFHRSYRMSVAEGVEKLRTKPALRAPAKGVKLSKGQKKTRIKRALNNTIKDIKKLEKNDPKAFTEAIGWYADDILKTIDILSNETQFAKDHPVLFTTILAITSNGQKVPTNYNDTADLSIYFGENSKLPVVDDVTTESGKPKKVLKIGDRVLGGVRNDTIGKHGNRLQFLIDKFGIEGAETWLTSEWTGREILQILEESGTGKTVAGLKITGTYKGMRIFGRKLGNFGLSFHDLTDEAVIDVWMTRWWNRQMGTPFLEDGSVAESPRNPQEFDLIVDAVQAITDEINKGSDIELSVASVQALIWYNEKDLYEKNDINVEKAVNYSEVANARNTTTKESKAQPSAQDAKLKGSEKGTPGVSQEVQEGDQKTSYRLAPTFYSKAERVVTEQFPPTMKSQSVENFLKKNQVKPEEIQWLDLETLLKGKQKVTKEELQEWIQANKIEVEDVMRSDEISRFSREGFVKTDDTTYEHPDYEYEIRYRPNIGYEIIDEGNPLDDESYATLNEAIDVIEEMETQSEDLYLALNTDSKPTKHSSYQLPGEKEDYRELLLTLPVDDMGDPFVGYVIFKNTDELQDFLDEISMHREFERPLDLTRTQNLKIEFNIPALNGSLFERILNKYSFSFKQTNSATYGLISKRKDIFTTGHYDEPNILAHVRFNTRRSPTGEKVLFIEELQSDWHTKGREKGYKEKIKKVPLKFDSYRDSDGLTAYVHKESGIGINEISEKTKRSLTKEKGYTIYSPGGQMLDIADTIKEAKEYATDYYYTDIKPLPGSRHPGVPDAPFKNNGWIELIMKRMLRYASENNFDRIAWTTANQQIDRWKNELRQNVDQISWQRTTRKKIEVGGFSTTTQEMMAESGYKGKEEIGDYVIVNGLKKNESVFNQTIPLEGETTINGQKVTLEGLLGKQMATQIRNSEDRTGVIEGDDLTVGGQGFKVVYDFAIKKILNKMGKKFNAKVDQVSLKTKQIKEQLFLTGDYFADENVQPSIPITRKMKESALKGQPTFRASKMTSTDDVLSSPSFKKWFKGSQVKDKDGKPLVVYHGTEYDFEDFDTRYGSYFSSDPKYAEGYASKPFSRKDKVSGITIGANIRPVYLSIKNPKILIEPKDDEDFAEAYRSHPYEQLKAEGYDGAIIKWNDGEVEAYVLEPTQIKSIFNKGTFNPHDPRISFRMAPTNLVTPLAKIYQEQKGTKKSYTKKDFENDLIRLGYPEETLKTAMDLFGIIRIKQIETDEPTPIEKELKKIQDLHITRSNLKDRIKRAYRLGAVEKEKEIVKLQKIVTKYARENLPKGIYNKSEVTGLLAKVRDAKRARELATALERIDRIVDRVNKRSALAKWNKTVKKKATVKKIGGIGRGKVGADVQDIVDDIRGKRKGAGIMDLSPVEVEEEIEIVTDAINKSEDGEPTDKQSIKLNLILTYGAIKHKTPEEITRATEQFDALVAKGRMMIMEDQQAYSTHMAEVRQEIIDVITGGAGPVSQVGAQQLGLKKKGLMADIKETLSTIDSHNQSLEYIFDKLSRLDKTSKPLESAINNYFMPMIRQARLAEYNGLVEMNTMLKENAEKIFKVKNKKLTKRLNENTVNTINVQHRDGIDGPIVFSELTYNEAYKKWMELQDATLHPTFENMGWNVNSAKRQIEEKLPKDMIEWAKWQLYDFYPMYYHRVNEVFRKRFNVNMPFNATYSPISRMVGAKADEGDDTLNKSKSPMGSMTSMGSLKGRVSTTKELAWVDGDTTILKHITEMEHFIHYTQVMRELRSVFMSEDVSNSIINFHGKGISQTLNKFMDDIARGGVDRSQNLHWMDKLRANFSRSVIGINPVVYLKQLASIPAYISDVPTLDWATEFAKIFNPLEFKRAYKTLSKSKMVEMRYDKGFERDMVLALQNQKPGKLLSGTDYINTIAYAFTKMGDKQAIFLGGWPVYKYHKKKALKEGKSLKDAETIAMKQFEASSLRSQQASDVEDLGDFQRRGSAYKLFTMFMTSPNQYYRMIISGYRNFKAGRGSRTENLRKIIVGQFVLTTLFQFISNAFEWDDEDQAISVLLYPFAGLLFFGQAFEYMIRSAFNKEYPMGPVSILDPIEDIGKGLKKTFDGKEFNNKKVFKILDEYISGLSKIFGIPYSGPKRSVVNTIKVAKEGSEKPIKEALGFRVKEKPKIKMKKKPKVGGPIYVY